MPRDTKTEKNEHTQEDPFLNIKRIVFANLIISKEFEKTISIEMDSNSGEFIIHKKTGNVSIK